MQNTLAHSEAGLMQLPVISHVNTNTSLRTTQAGKLKITHLYRILEIGKVKT